MGACASIRKVADNSCSPISQAPTTPAPISQLEANDQNRISEQILLQLSGMVSASSQEQISLLKRQIESQQEQIEAYKRVHVLEQQRNNDLERRLSSIGHSRENSVVDRNQKKISAFRSDQGRESPITPRIQVGRDDIEPIFESEGKINSDDVTRGIDFFFQRQDERKVKEVFETLCSIHRDGRKLADGHAAKSAMEKLGIETKHLNADNLTAFLDTDSDRLVSFEEFSCALKSPSKIERWTSSIPWNQLAAAVLNCCKVNPDEDPLRIICYLSQQEEAVVHKGLSDGLSRLLNEHIQQLRTAFTEMDNQQTSRKAGEQQNKFSMTREMQCGAVSSFYNGLSQRIGE